MNHDRQRLIDLLTGIHSSKLTHYSDLKAHIAEVEQRNAQLEILNRIAKSTRVDMSIGEMMGGIRESLGRLIPSLSLYLHTTETNRPEHLEWVAVHRRTLLVLPKTARTPEVPCTVHVGSDEQSVVLIPLVTRNSVAGILEIASHDTQALLSLGIPFLEQLGDQLAAALTNSRLYAEVLQRQQEWLLTFNAIKNPVLVVDREERVLQCNAAAVRFLPDKGDPHDGQPWWRLVLGAPDVRSFGIVAEAVRTGLPASGRFQDQQGKLFDVSVYPLVLHMGNAEGAIVYAKDVSDDVRYQAQLVQSARLAAIGQMAAGVAHELNSPLTVILGNTQLLQRSLDPGSPMHPLLQGILTSGTRCSRIIQDLLGFSRQDEYAFSPTDTNTVVRRVIALLGQSLEKDQVQVEADLAPDLPAIRGNEYKIEQVLMNLILNARDAVLDLEGIERRRLHVSTSFRETPEGPRVVITVRDRGTGIRPPHLREIFQPFFTTKAPGKGTGLGLWVSLGIAREHGGTLEVESVWRQGSAFSLVLAAFAEGGVLDEGNTALPPDSGGR